MDELRVKPRSVPIETGPPPEQKSLGWWIGFFAGTLVKVIIARNLGDAQAVARKALRDFAIHFDDIPETLRNDWLRISRRR